MNDAQNNDNAGFGARPGGAEEGAEFTPGPTSPVAGRGGEAAARARYEGAAKEGTPTADAAADATADAARAAEPAADSAPRADGAPSEGEAVDGEVLDDSPESLAAAFENETSEREQQLIDQLQRVSASYTNLDNEYKAFVRRSKRDQDDAKVRAIEGVIEALMPALDEIELARVHGDLTEGPFAKIAAKIETTLAGKYGVERYGAEGDPFDPNLHQAISHTVAELPAGTSGTTVVQVMAPGYRMGERVVRPAMVAVADPS